MIDSSDSYEAQSSRIADFILCSMQPFVSFQYLTECVPVAEEVSVFLSALKCDPYNRFNCFEENDAIYIGLNNLTEEDIQQQADIEGWRVSIAQYLDKVCAPIELGRIASLIERPINAPRNIRLKDIINSDYANRFCIHGMPDRLMLSRRISEDQLEESKASWRKNIIDFLFIQPRDTTLTVLGASVARPANLGGSRAKLLDLLQTDPEERFHFIYRSPTEIVVRVKLSDTQREWLHEKWRGSAMTFLLEQQRTVTLTELGAGVKRPSVHLGTGSSLRAVLTEDPQSRFILSGSADNIRVRLSAEAVEASSATEGVGEWREVSRKPTTFPVNRPASTAARTISKGGFTKVTKARQLHQTTEAELEELSLHQERWNTKPGSSSRSTGSDRSTNMPTIAVGTAIDTPQMHLGPIGQRQLSPSSERSGSGSGYGTTCGADSPVPSVQVSSCGTSAASAAHYGSSWDWRSPLEDGAIRASILQVPTASALPTVTPPGISSTRTPGPPSWTAPPSDAVQRRPSYKDKLVPVVTAVTVTPDSSKVIGRPAPSETSPQKSMPAISHSPSARSCTPLSSSYVAGYDSTSTGMESQGLDSWLPMVLSGFPVELVTSFVERLREEGFLSVHDLVLARSLGQLTEEFLGGLGFKVGHCNRVFVSLPK